MEDALFRAGRVERDARVLELLRALVRINTEHAQAAPGAPYGEGCARALTLALAECERRGMAVRRFSEKLAWAEVGAGEQLAMFPVHLDVVPAGEGWARDPYGAQVEDGVLYGRGCMDNKVGAALLIELLGELAAVGDRLPCRLRVVFGTDEETGMSDLREYVEAGGEQPSLGFVPDASFPAVRGEKARLHLRVSGTGAIEGLALWGGTAANVVPASAEARLAGGVALSASGTAAHGSMPERGDNAVAKLVRTIVDGGLCEAPELRCVCELLCRDLNGAALGIDVLDEVFGHTSVNLGTLRCGASGVTAELDVRFGTEISADEVVERVAAAFGPAWNVGVVQQKDVHLVGEDDPCLRALLAAYGRVTGDAAPEATVMAGGTYASYLPALVAFGPKLVGKHSGAHGINEHIGLSDISEACEIYREALRGIIALATLREA